MTPIRRLVLASLGLTLTVMVYLSPTQAATVPALCAGGCTFGPCPSPGEGDAHCQTYCQKPKMFCTQNGCLQHQIYYECYDPDPD